MYLGTSTSGWQLYGKTGSDYAQQIIGDTVYSENGWFVGFTKKGKQTYIFVANMSDVTSHKPAVLAGTRLQQIVKPILTSCGVL